MPKLSKAVAKKVDAAESKSFDVMPEGKYVLWLKEVDSSKEGDKGPYWVWTFCVADHELNPEGTANRQLWVNTSLSDAALWKFQEIFTAYGVDSDTDTDLLCGKSKLVLGLVTQTIIEKGARKGEASNQIDRLLPFDGTLDTGDADGGELDAGF